MKSQVAIAVSAALMSMAMSVEAASQLEVSISKPNLQPGFITAVHSKSSAQDLNAGHSAVFTPETNLPSGTYRYFVRLLESPVALYQGGIEGYQATSSDVVKGNSRKLDVNSQNVKSYRSFLNKRQDSVIQKAMVLLGELNVKQRTTLAYNGMVVEMTQAQAAKLATVPGIAHINREILRKPMSDSGPAIIKAPTVWSGEATGVESKGEGMIVGIIDTGINTDHPSFADIGGDGYDHTNPWGSGVYSGDCAGDFPELCNDKLIGVHSWPAVTAGYLDHDIDVPANGEDHNGHGSHTASTTAGNVLLEQAVPNANGESTGVVFDSMSGVAPHANIISYQVCLPGEDDAIGFSGCLPSLTVLAVEHAIEHGVDALNYSIGGGSSDPWNDADALAFLAARKAGIHVATSAGNSGPGPETVGSPGDAPWITTAAAYTHDRDFKDKTLSGFQGGDAVAPEALTGKAMTGAFAGPIVYAGDFENPNDPGSDPAQCLKPFPENTFESDTIVVCDRGAIARVDKGRNVLAGGAGALVLANVTGGADSVVADAHVLPAIHINAAQGNELRTWLASGEGHKASISGTEVVHDDKLARIAAEFTSRGPNKSVPDVIAPSIAAPGVSIFAAYANSQSAGFKESPDPADFAFLSGTSMASPHVAGALTLLASIHPEWTPAEIQSALMLTANQKTFKEDGKTPSDFFDMGAGFADIEAAAKTGLVMDETYVGYVKADPALGGQPSQINLPTMANAKCVDTCTWTRTVKATKAGSWTASAIGMADGLVLTVTPASFELAEGATQELTVTANVAAASEGWNFANIKLAAEGMPEVKLPVAVMANGDNLPGSIDIVAGRTVGSMTYSGFVAKDLTNIKAGIYDKASNLITPQVLSVPEDDYDAIVVTFSEVVPNIKFSTSSETAPDVDLRILDSTFAKIGSSAGPDSNESVAFTNLPAGKYYVVVDGYKASTPGGSDDVLVSVTSVLPTEDSLSDTASVKVKEEAGKFSLTFDWDTDKNANGILILESGDMSAMKQVPFSITRKDEVTQIANLSDSMVAGEANRVSFEVAANFTDADKEYSFTALMSAGHKVENISNGGVQEGNTITWTVVQKADSGENLSVGFDLVPTKAGDAFALKLTDELDGDMVEKTYKFGVMEVAPVANISAPTAVQELQDVVVNGTLSSDGNDDALTYKWVQTAGKVVAVDTSSGSLSFKAPEVGEGGDVLSFNLTVTDTQGNSDTQSVSIAVSDKPSNDGGALGWLSLLLVPFAWTRRKLKA
ncbi:S8 family serine peptidase [Shewanella sp. AS16]|uniref:S8 family serine peptidase n=1 Tax=Shewanella sp. AS16 TaxID=2907625 RepID=UPI001F1E43E8|nr:S8 family serine peptidase [Shewanella sp. AS16]MCE9685691.1 S8 family serine peptidase [Shewanella sp. AS16]